MIGLPTTGTLGIVSLSTDGLLSLSAVGVVLTSIDKAEVGEDGGWAITLGGSFPLIQGVYIDIVDSGTGITRPCVSGKAGSKAVLVTDNAAILSCYVPAMPLGGAYDIVATTEDGLYTSTLPNAITYIHRSFTTRLYSLRAAHPPPRDVGPYGIEDED